MAQRIRNPIKDGNLKSWDLKSGTLLKEFGTPLKMEIRNPSSTDTESGIQGVDSRIQDCLVFPYMEREKACHEEYRWSREPNSHFSSLQPGILDTLAEEESNSEDEDDLVDIDLVALEAAA